MKEDWETVLAETENQFTIITDLREMKAPAPVATLHENLQKMIIETGVSKVATVLNSTMTKWAVESICNQSGMAIFLKNFNNVADAEKWLDE